MIMHCTLVGILGIMRINDPSINDLHRVKCALLLLRSPYLNNLKHYTHSDAFGELDDGPFGRLINGQYTIGQAGCRTHVDHRGIFVDTVFDILKTQ